MGTGAWGRECGDGSMGTGAWGGSMGTGALGRERWDGSMGMAQWEQHCGNSTVSSKIFLHCMIEMIYFDGSIGKGKEGQQFFYYLFQKIFYIF